MKKKNVSSGTHIKPSFQTVILHITPAYKISTEHRHIASIYRVIHVLRKLLQEVISQVFVIKNVHLIVLIMTLYQPNQNSMELQTEHIAQSYHILKTYQRVSVSNNYFNENIFSSWGRVNYGVPQDWIQDPYFF